MKKILIFSFICFSQSLFAVYTCYIYANRAYQQADTNIKLNCRYTEGRWHTNWTDHYNWCNSVAIDVARKEDVLRHYQLEICMLGGVENCNIYATRAVRQNDAALALKCNFTGNRWQSNYNNHYNWCVTASPEATYLEDSERRRALQSCMVYPPSQFEAAFYGDFKP